MTATRDFDDIARAWLDLMPDEAPDRAVAAVIDAVATTRQMRRPIVNFRRTRPMSRLLLAGAAAVLVVASGIILLGPRRSSEVASPSSAPSPTATASAPLVGDPLGDPLRATWLAVAGASELLGTGDGPVSMSVSSAGTGIGAGNFGAGHGYSSVAALVAPDQIALQLERDGDGCKAGARGLYRWLLSEGGLILNLTIVSEDCRQRGIVFARAWARSLEGATTVGAGVVDTMDPDFAINLPDDMWQSRTLDDFIEIGGSNGASLMVFKNPQPFVDACSQAEERVPYKPGAAGFVDAFRRNDAFVVSETTSLKISGLSAIHVTIGGKADYARCPGAALYEYTPKNCVCHFIVGQGDADSMYLVDVGSDTFMFIVSPINNPDERSIIDSIQIPYALPGH